MKKILNWVLAATLICGASVFTSCEKSDTVLSDKILGKWIVAELDGEVCPTSWKSVVTFESANKGYYSLSEIVTMTWENKSPAQVTFSKDGFTAIEEDGTYKSVLTVTVNSITNKEMLLKTDWTLTGGSYGIEVARLAGVPQKVITRARDLLKVLEQNSDKGKPQFESSNEQMSFAGMTNESALDKLRKTNISELSDAECRELLEDMYAMIK